MLETLRNVKRKVVGGQSEKDSFDELFALVQANTYCDYETLKSLARLARLVDEAKIEGDFVECGTYKGGSAAVIAHYMKAHRHLWLYDSFQGLPPATEVDGADAQEWTGKCYGTETEVLELMKAAGVPENRFTLMKGWFNETFKEHLPEKVAFLHCDADWYDSVLLVLETFYPRMENGAVIVLDDFGAWEGCREAFYDFCQKHNVKPLLERVAQAQAFWVKGKTTNRPPREIMTTMLEKEKGYTPEN